MFLAEACDLLIHDTISNEFIAIFRCDEGARGFVVQACGAVRADRPRAGSESGSGASGGNLLSDGRNNSLVMRL